ncbi:MAG: prepilin-type N-terminal cleavage/methylation domain-containing protein [Nitrosomonadales bacterium]|nr:prepilin-type N-terminal cleavage/methylation domain-containing protein [Nitrosomonadales bacterium]
MKPLTQPTKTAGIKRQRGVSLIELVMFIVIISVAVTGVLLVMNQVTRHSADSLVRKQALAIAESLLEEVELMPFTYCDPNDPAAASAVNATVCAVSQDVITGPTPNTETRYSTADPFDNVADYGNFNMPAPPGIFSMTDGITPIAGLGNYSANVSITRAGTALLGVADNGAALRITITVTAPDNSNVVLDGYRTRYAPNDLP